MELDGPPSSLSQRPQSFHPDFDCEVYMVIFSVSAISSKAERHQTNLCIRSTGSTVKDLRSTHLEWLRILIFFERCSLIAMGILAFRRTVWGKELLTIRLLFLDVRLECLQIFLAGWTTSKLAVFQHTESWSTFNSLQLVVTASCWALPAAPRHSPHLPYVGNSAGNWVCQPGTYLIQSSSSTLPFACPPIPAPRLDCSSCSEPSSITSGAICSRQPYGKAGLWYLHDYCDGQGINCDGTQAPRKPSSISTELRRHWTILCSTHHLQTSVDREVVFYRHTSHPPSNYASAFVYGTRSIGGDRSSRDERRVQAFHSHLASWFLRTSSKGGELDSRNYSYSPKFVHSMSLLQFCIFIHLLATHFLYYTSLQ